MPEPEVFPRKKVILFNWDDWTGPSAVPVEVCNTLEQWIRLMLEKTDHTEDVITVIRICKDVDQKDNFTTFFALDRVMGRKLWGSVALSGRGKWNFAIRSLRLSISGLEEAMIKGMTTFKA